ncbi:MAG: thioredoxin domain-containing protein [Bradymonadaceae bacterium]|nr:thioredoxin domain-containing protein [Lujinxingiaceae bacterium]
MADSYIAGNLDAAVTIVVFSDFQCPFCARGGQTLDQVRKKYGDQVRVVFKHFPLPFHQQAPAASRAALAAGEQGKFWQMHDLLYANMQRFNQEDMGGLTSSMAEDLGLDVARFQADMANPAYDAIIARDLTLGQDLGIRGTPQFFINGRHIKGAQPLAMFEAVIADELEGVRTALAEGLDPALVYAKRLEANFEAAIEDDRKGAPVPVIQKAPSRVVHMVPVHSKDAVKGAKTDYLVTIVEYSSFQCPFCERGAATLRELEAKYPKNVRFVFKHFPLPFHQHSEPASRAAIAAGEQGKFWPMYDLLYARQRELSQEGIFEEMAEQLGLKLGKFKEDMAAAATVDRVKQDHAAGSTVGVRGTPGYFVNGVSLIGAKPIAEFVQEIDQQIEIATRIKKEKKLKGEALYAAVVEHNKALANALEHGGEPTPEARPSDEAPGD